MSSLKFEMSTEETGPVFEALLAGLKEYNQPYHPYNKQGLTLSFKDESGTVVAGLAGATDCDWLFIRFLWVSPAMRGQDLGTKLVQEAEAEAKRRGCHSVWLDTYSFQARGFYEKLGYSVFGILDAYPPGHQRIFFQKKLT